MLPNLNVSDTIQQEPLNSDSPLSASELQSQMKKLLETSEGADIQFAVTPATKEQSKPIYFPAHQLILSARSPYFKEMLEAKNFDTNSKDNITIEHCEPIVFKILLEFIYTGECDLIDLNSTLSNDLPVGLSTAFKDKSAPLYKKSSTDTLGTWKTPITTINADARSNTSAHAITDDAIFKLLGAAVRFKAADLGSLCENYLVETLSPDNCFLRLSMADEIGQLDSLRQGTIRFIVELAPEIKIQEAYINNFKSLSESLRKDILGSVEKSMGLLYSQSKSNMEYSSIFSISNNQLQSTTFS